MPVFLAKVKEYPCARQIQHAIMIIMLTGVHVSELLQAHWNDLILKTRFGISLKSV